MIRNNTYGYMLVTAMIFLLIFSLMSLSAVNESVMSAKVCKNFTELSKLLSLSENALQKIEHEIKQGNVQAEGMFTLNDVMAVSFHTESLGIDTCAHVKNISNTVANYYRVRITVKNKLLDIPLSVETTEILPVIFVNETHSCEKGSREVFAGRQSWRVV